MFDSFVQTLTNKCHIKKGDAVVVCCSGGIDSMVLMDMMIKASSLLEIKTASVHIEHGLRGMESARDALFVEEECKKAGIRCHVASLDMDPETPNLEEQARYFRYAAIRDLKQRHGFMYAATGHNMDDQAETIIYRMTRGSGIRGFSGMDYVRPDNIIRPLLDFSRNEIKTYADINNIRFVQDSSNNDTTFARNLIRHEIIPIMQRINPRAIMALARTSRIARQESEVLKGLCADLEDTSCVLDWGIIKAFRKETVMSAHEAVIKRFIIKIASEMLGDPRGIDAVQVDAVMDVLTGKIRGHSIKRKIHFMIDRKDIVCMNVEKRPCYTLEIENPGSYAIPEIKQSVDIAFPFPSRGYIIRPYMPGDRIGGKRVAEIMSDHRIMRSLKGYWPVLLKDGEVIAVADMMSASTDICFGLGVQNGG